MISSHIKMQLNTLNLSDVIDIELKDKVLLVTTKAKGLSMCNNLVKFSCINKAEGISAMRWLKMKATI